MSSWRSGAWRSGAWRAGAWRTAAGGPSYAFLQTAYATAVAGTLTPELSVPLIGAGATASQGSAPYPWLTVGLQGAAVTALFGRIRFPDSDAPPADISLWALDGALDLTAITLDGLLLAATPEQALALRTYAVEQAVLSVLGEDTPREEPAPLFAMFDTTVWTLVDVPATLEVVTRPAELFAVVLPEDTAAEDPPDNLTVG